MFVHLHCHSAYSFLDGASPVQALVERAADLGMPALALTDHDNVAGAVEFDRAARAAGIKPIQGVELTLLLDGDEPAAGSAAEAAGASPAPGPGGASATAHLVLLATGPAGYARLCRLLTRAHLEQPRGRPALPWSALLTEVAPDGEPLPDHGLIALSGCRRGPVLQALLQGDRRLALRRARQLRDAFGRDHFYVELQGGWLPGNRALNRTLADLAEHLGVGVVATNDVHYATRDRFAVHDLLTCVRLGIPVDEPHPQRHLNAHNDLKAPRAMARMFADHPRALEATLAIAERCRPVLPEGAVPRPAYPLPPGVSAAAYLREQVERGALWRYGRITPRIRQRLEHELAIIEKLELADYFLLVWDVARYARQRGIRCAGRGSAADSAVAYCLGITDVDAIERGLLFERFLSLERAEQPDIDLDLDARYRDQVADYVERRYGPAHVATVCTYQTYHARGALRDFGKALGFPPEVIDRIAKRVPYYLSRHLGRALQEVPELRDLDLPRERFRRLVALCEAAAGLPRHMGTHLGGLVISRRPLVELSPLQRAAKGCRILQFDKRGVEELGLVKLDLLPLRTLGAVEEAVRVIRRRDPGFDYDRIPLDDRATYALLGSGETVGAFQLESPAQRALQPRLKPENLEDVVASVALIRPGPIKGDMVEPFLARRRGREPVTYLHPKLEPILRKTWGVVLFQEQVIEIATAIAGFTPGEADRLRRVMTHARSSEEMEDIGRHFLHRARQQGVDEAVAQAIFRMIQGYASYGFCEAHAAAFGVTAYKTAYLLAHYPAEWYAALLSLQPMGYYPPNTLCVEAARRGIRILPLDVNASQVGFTATPGAIRIGLRAVKGLGDEPAAAIVAERERGGPFRHFMDFLLRMAGSSAGGGDWDGAAETTSGEAAGGPAGGGPGAEPEGEPGAPRGAPVAQAGGRTGRPDGRGHRRGRGSPRGPVLDRDQVAALIRAGAFDSLHPNRRALLWGLDEALAAARSAAGDGALARALAASWSPPVVADFPELEKWAMEREVLGIDVHRRHLLAMLREVLDAQGYRAAAAIRHLPAGAPVRAAGIPVRPHRPPTRSGRVIVFLSLEDETGLVDVTVFEAVYQRYGRWIFTDPPVPLAVEGVLQDRDGARAVLAHRVIPLAAALRLQLGPRPGEGAPGSPCPGRGRNGSLVEACRGLQRGLCCGRDRRHRRLPNARLRAKSGP
ncbi:DNA polymerase III subunit alpha [Thermaerobacter composti]|uniref:DNA-directed DNA polymerase n=1 Tax=Thermaerobacter composti TaxID=554949 RepID=A0ABZ0QT05_9FIRM|nr:DNA polymerase III subunit alpha [Thermaerobacter composti]WPD19807.1 DNA polymerase III subunit alpha [Thermaerobacter composti]